MYPIIDTRISIMPRLSILLVSLFCLFTADETTAHELWLEPTAWQVDVETEVKVDIINGEEFSGSRLAYFERRAKRFEVSIDTGTTTITARSGDIPAATLKFTEPGLARVIYETTASTITYREWEKFAKFAAHKNFGANIRARHESNGFPIDEFKETYTRHAKALIAVGDGLGSDVESGLESEIVALTNPYAPDFDGQMRVQVLYQGEPRQNAQIEVFQKAPDGTVSIDATPRTDSHGMVTVSVLPGHEYLFDAVVLREAPANEGAVWHTLWAALSFLVAEK